MMSFTLLGLKNGDFSTFSYIRVKAQKAFSLFILPQTFS